MSIAKRLALVVACTVCLIIAASALPAADPRLDSPGSTETEGTEWDSVADTGTEQTPAADETEDTGSDESENTTEEINADLSVKGDIYPGNTVSVRTVNMPAETDSYPLTVNGDQVGSIDARSSVEITVPAADEMIVAAPGVNARTTVDVETDASLSIKGARAPTGAVTAVAQIESDSLPNADVYFDGEKVGTTDGDGEATVRLPPTAGERDLRVDRGVISGQRTVNVEEPTVRLGRGLLVPGSKTVVKVTADGEPIENASVSVGEGQSTLTDSSGRAFVRLPVDDEVTVTATVGQETVTTTESSLYVRTAAIMILVPGLVIGGIWTYITFIPKHMQLGWSRRRRHRHSSTTVPDPLAELGKIFSQLGEDIARLLGLLASGTGTLAGGFALSSQMFPSLSVGVPSLSLGSLFSIDGSDTDPTSSSSWLNPFRSTDDEDESPTIESEATPDTESSKTETISEREQLRNVWHAFLDKLGIENRETLTPGEVARRAVTAGYPGKAVGGLLSVFRDVEYGNSEPTPDRVERAKQAVDTLADYEPDDSEEDSS